MSTSLTPSDDAARTASVRLASLVEPRSRVLHVDAVPDSSLVRALRARSCEVITVTGKTAEHPSGEDAGDRVLDGLLDWPSVRHALGQARFDVAVLPTSLTDDWRPFGRQLQALMPFLSPAGYANVAIAGAGRDDRGSFEPELLRAGLVIGHVEVVEPGADAECTLIVMAFPLPALDITAFRDQVHALERRGRAAEQDAIRADLRARQLTTECDGLRERFSELDGLVPQLRARADDLQRRVERALADAEAARARERRHASTLTALEAELLRFRDIAQDPDALRSELVALRAELQEAGARMQVLRRSFSWRLTAPVRFIAGLLGRTTTDRALGWQSDSPGAGQ